MRKILLLSTVCLMSFGLFTQNEANALYAQEHGYIRNLAREDTVSKLSTEETLQAMLDYLKQIFPAVAEENSGQQAAAAMQNTAGQTYLATTNAQTGKDVTNATIFVDSMGQAAALCQAVSGEQSTAAIHETSDKAEEEFVERMNDIMSGNAGTDSANGLIDYQRNLFERAMMLCSPSSVGGNATYCSGTGAEHVTLSTLLSPTSLIGPEYVPLNYLEEILYGRIPLSINPDLLEDPTTDVMNAMVESDRIKAEMSIGQAVFSKLRAGKTKFASASAAASLKERMDANGWSQEKIAKTFDYGMSKDDLYSALTVGSFGTPFMTSYLSRESDRALLVVIAKELMLNNTLQYEQYKLLQSIALATSTTVIANREQAIQNLNQKIQSLNGGR